MENRVDTLGYFVFKYSDDHGKTWSTERHEIPVRETEVDRRNVYGGKVRFFWQVGRPLIDQGAAYVTLHKVGNFGPEFMTESEGNFLRSDNLLTERDAGKIRWETLPDGDIGLRSPVGDVAEEQSIVALSDGSLFTVYRTQTDYPVQAYSRDQGHTWTKPEFMTYGPGARKVKHTRAANFVWNAGNGRYLYWFHNHGGNSYDNQRNPGWLAAGHEVDTVGALHPPKVVLSCSCRTRRDGRTGGLVVDSGEALHDSPSGVLVPEHLEKLRRHLVDPRDGLLGFGEEIPPAVLDEIRVTYADGQVFVIEQDLRLRPRDRLARRVFSTVA
jgi:hypothetical protein